MTSRRSLSAALALAAVSTLTAAALAGCSAGSAGSGGSASSPTPAATIAASAIPTAVPDPAAVLPAGDWALVYDNTITPGTSYAYRVLTVTKGHAGDLADASADSSSGTAALKDGVPYYVALQFATLSGDAVGAQTVSAFTFPDVGITGLSVPADLEHCDPAETDAIPSGLGELQVRCLVALGTEDAAPTRVVIRGSANATEKKIGDVATLAVPQAE